MLVRPFISTIANEIEAIDSKNRSNMSFISRLFAQKPFRVKRYEDDNIRVYKTIPLQLPWRPDLNYSARTNRIGFDALPANDSGRYCGVLLMRPTDPLAQANSDPAELRKLLDDDLPQFSTLVDDDVLSQVAAKPISRLPAFRYVTPRLHHGSATLLLGDCAHTVKPYFGLGANSALEDAQKLIECLQQQPPRSNSPAAAIRQFSKQRSREAKTLVRVSRDLDRPGKLGFLTFLLPIILDGIFGRLAPRLFAPNIITMLQRDSLTFCQAARRKRIDRCAQVCILGGVGGVLFTGVVLGMMKLWGAARALRLPWIV